ncbi:MAG TPA: tRNA(His) guanylyltransferase Thg1 family protein, partial [Blastocatellia bacterium]|nr:tRNA(His) guanylyltransferase Thg1 family protein [Blastocatellia bacterium]
MKFDDLDARMRLFETAYDLCVLPGIYMVARIDGRNFTRLTKETLCFESPYDSRFRDHMISTTEHLMNCGFRVTYGHTQSDEISLLFHSEENAFSRKVRKYDSILAGEASSKFSLLLNHHAAFDCRISQLPNPTHVCGYFSWRMEDAHRNALNDHCYWKLRRDGVPPEKAASELMGMSIADKNELLFKAGVNFNDLPKL